MATAKLLTLIAFAASANKANPDSIDLALTVKGPAALIPAGATQTAGPKGTRIVTVNHEQAGLVEEVGKVIQVGDAVTVDAKFEGVDAWYGWFLAAVPAEQGGTQGASVPSDAASDDDENEAAVDENGEGSEGNDDVEAEATEPEPVAAPAKKPAKNKADPRADRDAELRVMTHGERKKAYATKLGKNPRPGMTTDDVVNAILSAEFGDAPAAEPAAPKAPKAAKPPKAPEAEGEKVDGRKNKAARAEWPDADEGPFHYGVKGAKATGSLGDGGKFTVAKGSTCITATSPTAGAGNLALRQKLIDDGVIKEKGGVLTFTKDHEFATPSQAATMICACAVNGRTAWKRDEDNATINDLSTGTTPKARRTATSAAEAQA